MKVVLVNEKYYPHVSGGAEKSVKLLADGLRNIGVTVEVVTPSPVGLGETRSVDGVRVHYLPLRNFYWPFDGGSRSPWSTFSFRLRDALGRAMVNDMIRKIREIGPDIVHTNNFVGIGFALWRAARAQSLPVVHTVRDYSLMCPGTARFRDDAICTRACAPCMPFAVLNRRLSRYVDGVAGNSRDVLDRHLQAGYFAHTSQRRVIHNAVESCNGGDRRSATGRTNSRSTFAFLGRIIPEKGLHRLLAATRRLPPDGWQLLVAGTGDGAYVGQLREEFPNPAIRWLGWADPRAVYNEADWVVVPSLWNEPLPRVILEAHAEGVPVLATRRGGIAEILRDGNNGLLYDPDDPAALPAMLERILRRDVQVAVASDIAGAVATLAPACVAERYTALYREVLAARRCLRRSPDFL